MASSHPSSKYTDAGLNILSCGAPPSSASSPVVTGWVVRLAAGDAFFDFGFEHLGMMCKSQRAGITCESRGSRGAEGPSSANRKLRWPSKKLGTTLSIFTLKMGGGGPAQCGKVVHMSSVGHRLLPMLEDRLERRPTVLDVL